MFRGHTVRIYWMQSCFTCTLFNSQRIQCTHWIALEDWLTLASLTLAGEVHSVSISIINYIYYYYYLFGGWLDLHCVDSQFQFQFFPSRLRWLVKRTLVNFNSYHSHVGRWLADCPALSFRFVYLHNKQISKCKTVEFVAGPALRWTSVSFSILSFGRRISRRDIITRTYSIRVF